MKSYRLPILIAVFLAFPVSYWTTETVLCQSVTAQNGREPLTAGLATGQSATNHAGQPGAFEIALQSGLSSRSIQTGPSSYWEAAIQSVSTAQSNGIPYHEPVSSPGNGPANKVEQGNAATQSQQLHQSQQSQQLHRVNRPLGTPHPTASDREPIAEIKRPHPSVARLIAFDKDGQQFGSGTLVGESGEYGIVLTNWHVVNGADGLIHVHFPNNFGSFGAVIAIDKKWDLAAVAISKPPANGVPRIPVSRIVPRPGDPLWIVGYGAGSYRMAGGHCVRYLAPEITENGIGEYELIDLSVNAREGDSGGPILNADGEIAGVLFGSDHKNTVGSNCTKVRQFLTLVEPVFARLQDHPENLFLSIEPEGPRRQLIDSARMHSAVRAATSQAASRSTGSSAGSSTAHWPKAGTGGQSSYERGNAGRATRSAEQSAVFREPVRQEGRKSPIRQQSYDRPYDRSSDVESVPRDRDASTQRVPRERYQIGADPDVRSLSRVGSMKPFRNSSSGDPLPADYEIVLDFSLPGGTADGATESGGEHNATLWDARPGIAGWIFALLITSPMLISVLRRQVMSAARKRA